MTTSELIDNPKLVSAIRKLNLPHDAELHISSHNAAWAFSVTDTRGALCESAQVVSTKYRTGIEIVDTGKKLVYYAILPTCKQRVSSKLAKQRLNMLLD